MRRDYFFFILLSSLVIFISSFIVTSVKYVSQISNPSTRILGSENYIAQTTCTEPGGGCGTNYYWDQSTCSCIYSPPASCTTPSDGCGTNYYWDSTACMCKPSTTTCTEPSGGCGTNWYWDSTSCMCKQITVTTGACSPPTNGCGTNYYWDSAACMCKSSTSTCIAPSSGCPVNYYWDYSSCVCMSSGGGTTCTAPSSGCGYNYYWDQYSCSCKYYTSSCVPPASGCGTNRYFDYVDCNCKDYVSGSTACTQPASGCGYNYYWDSSLCYCKQNPNVTLCSMPSFGCSSNTYWDSYSCSCKSTYTSYQQSNFDRLAYETPERVSCVKSLLTQYEFDKLRYFIPTTTSEQDEIYKLGDKAKSCWGGSVQQVQTGSVAPSQYKSPYEYENCLIKVLGEEAYRQIYSGVKTPTYEEHLKYKACYGGKSRVSTVTYFSNQETLPETTIACLKTILTGGLYEKVRSGTSDVPYEIRDKVNRCFGINPQAFEEARMYKAPDTFMSCLYEKVGSSRFQEIQSGKSQPTNEERQKAESCKSLLNKDQTKFLPPPSEQVHFLEPKPELVNVSGYEQDSQNIEGKNVGGKIVFSGTAIPNSVINIYIYSEPIVVTTKTDENGDWVYELDQPLKGEHHIAYATVRSDDGEMVRSQVLNFTIQAAPDEPAIQQFIQETSATKTQRSFLYYSVVALIITALSVLGVIAVMNVRKISMHQQPNSSGKRDSEGKF